MRYGRNRLGAMVMVLALLPAAARAQGAGATGAQILQFLGGSRAPALSGAYTAGSNDADALFYNPAGVATLSRAAAFSYERYVADVSLVSAGGLIGFQRLTVGVSGIYLNSGEINELIPDPDFGGNRGTATGRTFSSSEVAARLTVATSLAERLRAGLSAGLVSASLAEVTRQTPMFDLGAQYDFSFGTIGVSLNNVGAALSGHNLRAGRLPTEVRVGAITEFTSGEGPALTLHTDLLARLNEGSAGVLLGAEGGWRANARRTVGAVARLGYDAAEGEGGLGAFKLGAGISTAQLSLDYTFQHLEFLGGVHRLGVRWSVAR
jgi:hypothetical protein